MLRDPASSRSVFIRKADSTKAIIDASQPSDCLLLHPDHIRCGVGTLWVLIDCQFINSVNGPPEQQSSDNWKRALNHLLRTFRPSMCFMDNPHHPKYIFDGHRVQVEDGTSYGTYWNEADSLLCIIK